MRVEIVLPKNTIVYNVAYKNASPTYTFADEELKVFVTERLESIVINGKRVRVHEFCIDPSPEASACGNRSYISAQTLNNLRLASCKN